VIEEEQSTAELISFQAIIKEGIQQVPGIFRDLGFYLGSEKLNNNPSSVSCGSLIRPRWSLTSEVVTKTIMAVSISDLSTAFLPLL
jgi:hypothetical protein